jgi:hypothetical protein
MTTISWIFFIGAVAGAFMVLIDKWEIDRFISNRTGWWCHFCVTFWVCAFLTALVLIYQGFSIIYLFIPFASVHIGLFLYRLSNGEY